MAGTISTPVNPVVSMPSKGGRCGPIPTTMPYMSYILMVGF